MTNYIYSATGEKLRVIYQTAVPNIEVAIGETRELTTNELVNKKEETVDYLLGGALTLKNGRIDKYQFEEGYCQAKRYNNTMDDFTFCYYDKDHLGDIRQVTKADGSKKGTIIQKMNYYPFGAEFCDNGTKSYVQNHKYNGKEFDNMHGLNTYDYGARQYNPILCRMDKIDRFCEKDYSHSPYTYCMGNPIRSIDVNGDSCIILLAPYGARDAGHMAIAIQNDKGEWCLYSKNGTPKGVHAFGPEGAPGTIYHNDRGEKKAKNISGLFNDDTINPSARKSNPNAPENAPEYTEGYMLPTTSEEDQKNREGVMSYIDRDYSLIASNCAQTVQYGLFNAQLPMGKGMLPKAEIYPSIMKANPNGRRIVYYNTKTEKYHKYAK